LDYTDRFEMITVADPPPASTSGRGSAEDGPAVNYGLYRALGAQFAVEVADNPGGVTVRLHDINVGKLNNQKSVALPPATSADFRLEVHRLADEVARWATGVPGAAASRLLFVSSG